MKVLYITPCGIDTSPQIEMAKFLKPRLERLDLFVHGREPFPTAFRDWDVVFAAMEDSVPIGHRISQQLQIPIYSHWEWIPPYRIYGYPGGDDPRNWGFRDEHMSTHFKNNVFYDKYRTIISCAIESDISSCAGSLCKEAAQKFSGNSLDNCFLKYPASPIPLEKERNNDKMDYFITVSRLHPNKRVGDLAAAVKKADLDCTWVIVGDGPEKKIIQDTLEGSKTKLEFFSKTDGEKKFSLLSQAKFQISGWHGLPQLEAALVGTATINLHIPYIKELYGESLTWASDIADLSEKIKTFYSNPKLCRKNSDVLYDAALNNQLNINTLEQGANIIEGTLKKLL